MQSGILACFGRSRIACTLVLTAGLTLMLTMFPSQAAAAPATTVINDIVYRADGTPATGQMLLSWPAFITSDGKPIAAGTMSVAIPSGGSVSLELSPNEGATPSGTYYKVVLKLNDGTTSTEYWTVPKKSPAKVSEVRSQIMPATVAVQMASRQYVESTMSLKADDGSVMHKAGDETVAGTKQFSLSPIVPTPATDSAAAPKSYVDTKVASIGIGDYVRKSGDTMLGSLSLASDPVTANQAANRHYVDTQDAGLNSTLALKLGRQNDTPITMGGMRFASQFPSIQAAITDAGSSGSVVIPSDYSGTDTFTNPNSVQVLDLRGGASSLRGAYNVRDFGAKPDDGVDDWAAIQAAIDAASAGGGPFGAVFVPRGIYNVSKPLHVTRGIRFFGAGRGETTITGFSADQGAVLVVSPPISLYPGLPTGTSLATGTGNSMYLSGGYGYMLNLREGGAVELNGRNALTVEFFFKPDQSVGGGSYNILSSAGSVTGPDGNVSFAIQHVGTDALLAKLNVNGSVHGIYTPNSSVTAGNVYHVAFTYDGTTMRLFINGVLKASEVNVGTITQKSGEDFTLGNQVGAFPEATFDNPMTKGWVDSLRISSSPRYTANFTPPAAKHSNDGNTLFLLNFDNNYDQFTVASTMYGSMHLFLRRFGGGFGQVGNFHLSDMSFIGTGPEFIYMVSSMIDNVQITAARRGLAFVNNCYLNRLNSVRVVGSGSTQFGIGIGAASGVLTMSDISLSAGHFPFVMNTSSASIHGLWVEMGQGTEIGGVFRGDANSTVVIDHPVFSSETNPNTIRYGLAEVAMGTTTLSGGVIETSYGAPHIGIFGGGTFVHLAGNYSHKTSTPASVFQIVTAPTNPVQLIAPMQQGTTVPWADNMAWVQLGGGNGYTLTLMNTGANAPINSTTYYFGGDIADSNNSSFDAAKIEIPRSGTIKRIHVRQNVPSGNTGSAENVTHKVCINSATNCFGSASFGYGTTSTFSSDATLNQAVSAGDTIAVRVDTPAWVTRPTNVRWYATVYIE